MVLRANYKVLYAPTNSVPVPTCALQLCTYLGPVHGFTQARSLKWSKHSRST